VTQPDLAALAGSSADLPFAGGIDLSELTGNEEEAVRLLTICNACRYCEGFCPVFPAMTRRLEFGKADVNFLANLCHNCGACLHSCQYASPHEFAVNVPKTFAKVRLETYSEFAWPRFLGALYRRNGTIVSLALAAGLSLFLILAVARNGSLSSSQDANFYTIFPHNLMVLLFAPIFLFAAFALAMGVRTFWRESPPGPASLPAAADAAARVLSLEHLDGGHGEGCNNESDRYTLARRNFHHFLFYGFLLCFAATSTATLYHYLLNWPAPYPLLSLPKIFGVTGGIGMLLGGSGLLWLNLRRDPDQCDVSQNGMDRGFILLLLLIAASGLALIPAKQTAWLPVVLCIHLGGVMALFATMPYGKFAHGIFRSAALLKWAIERRQPSKLKLSDD